MRFFCLSSCSWLLLLAAGCGGNVILDAATGGAHGASGPAGVGGGPVGVGGGPVGVGASGAGGGTVLAGAGGAVGFGGGTSVVSASSVSSASSGGTGGSSTSCGGATYFQLVVPGTNMAVSLTSSCTDFMTPAPVPFAYLTEGGPDNNPGSLTLEGCASSAANSQGIILRLSGATKPGTYSLENAAFTYVDANGLTHGEDSGGTLVIYDFQPPGGLVVGSFDAKATGGNAVPLQAKFAVCRLPDVDVP